VGARTHPALLSRRVAYHQGKVWNGTKDDGARPNESKPAYDYTTEDGCVCSNRGIRPDQCRLQRCASFLNASSRIVVVRQNAIWAEEDVVLNRYALPDCNSILDRDIVSEGGAGLDEGVISDIAIRADPRTRHNVSESPYSGSAANVRRLDEGIRVYEVRVGARGFNNGACNTHF
jgi:hypothetical protein